MGLRDFDVRRKVVSRRLLESSAIAGDSPLSENDLSSSSIPSRSGHVKP